MKNLFKKYGIILALIVWAIAALPFIKIFFSSGSTGVSAQNNIDLLADSIHNKSEPFLLLNNYGDPFLKKQIAIKAPANSYGQPASPRPKNKPEEKIKKPEAPKIQLPVIVYTGLIKNKQNDKEVGLFTINGNNALLAVNQQQEGITLLKLFKDSALIQFEKEKLFVRK